MVAQAGNLLHCKATKEGEGFRVGLLSGGAKAEGEPPVKVSVVT